MKQVSRVELHTPKKLIIQFHTSSVWETACHTIFLQIRKMGEKRYKLITAVLILIKQSGDKNHENTADEKAAHLSIPIYGNCLTGVFLMSVQNFFLVILKKCPEIFFKPQIELNMQTNMFRKKCFVCKIYFFCVHNVVLDTLMLGFSSFSLYNFFSKMLKCPFFLYGMVMYALINV